MSSVPAGMRARARAPAGGEQAGVALLAFFGLAAFAAVRYSALIATPPAGRAVLVAACVTAGCALLVASGRIGRGGPAVALLRLALVLGTFALSMLALHIPAHLLAPGQWRHLADRLSTGTGELSGWLWPYRGGDQWAQAAVLLPVPAVLLVAGCAWFWPSRALLASRRALALAGLLAIFVIGTANAPASVPAFDGVVLVALLAATVLAPLTAASEAGRALLWLAACAAAALAVQAALRSDGPWIHYREPGAAAAAGAGVTFQWTQLYGPDRSPRTQAPMLIVTEPRPELVRMTSLDRFDGLRFLRSAEPPGSPRFDLPAAEASRWSERAIIEVRGLRSSILASGGGEPTRINSLDNLKPMPAEQGDGTALTPGVAVSGATYEVASYDPHPAAQTARRAPRAYPRAYLPYAQFYLPAAGASALVTPNLGAETRQAPAGARLIGPSTPGSAPGSDPRTASLIEASPYGPMFALARGLSRGAASDYDVAQRIDRYLQGTYGYDRTVPLARYPLEAFLFSQRRGYCQQFSGAMALMLRMDGIPARVGVGFLPSARGPRAGTWEIRASDAHAWAEVFFTGIGWVSFDPTPPTAAGASLEETTALSRTAVFGGASVKHAHRDLTGRAAGRVRRPGGGGLPWPVLLLLIGGAVLVAAGGSAYGLARARRRRRSAGDEDPAIAELRRALEELGRAEPGLTLAQLEGRLTREGHARAARYVNGLARRRFGGDQAGAGTPPGRGHLRRALARRGIAGRARALFALPPEWTGSGPRRR